MSVPSIRSCDNEPGCSRQLSKPVKCTIIWVSGENRTMSCVFCLKHLLLLLTGIPPFSAPQLVEGLVNIRFLPDARTFAAMAVINAAGFDLDADKLESNPARKLVRERLSRLVPDLRERLRRFYEAHNTEHSHLDQQSKYISYALLLSGPPQFTLTVPAAALPSEAAAVLGFEALLQELWKKGELERLWQEVRPFYADEAESYRPLVREMILETLRYLRIETRVSLDRKVIFMPELLNAFGVVNARNVGDDYYVVVGPSTKDGKLTASVRHEYLHYQLDPLVGKYRGLLPEAGPFLKKMKQMPSAIQPYKDDFPLMVAESLVLATELRLRWPERMTRTLNLVENYERGLILVPYFDEALENFEKGSDSILEIFPAMIEGISWGVESKRGAAVERLKQEVASRSAEAAGQKGTPPAHPLSSILALLEQANVLLLARKFDEAEPVLKQILVIDEANAGALFGLAQIAARSENLDRALELYAKAAANAKDQPWIAGWCLVQRGNILMHQGEYARARAEWARVSELHGDLRGAAEAAAKALSETRTPPAP